MAESDEDSLPSDYVPMFSTEDVKERYTVLVDLCLDFIAVMEGRHASSKLRFDHLVMANVAKSAMDDIWRYKAYHQRNRDKKSNAVKRAAYFTKWITRLRPIYFNRPGPDEGQGFDHQDTSLLLNEGFALHFSFTTIAGELKRESLFPEPEFMVDLMYDLRYRGLSGNALMTVFEMIYSAAEGDRLFKE